MLVQGNSPEDLPEHLIAVARVYRVDLARLRYFSEIVPPSLSAQPNESLK